MSQHRKLTSGRHAARRPKDPFTQTKSTQNSITKTTSTTWPQDDTCLAETKNPGIYPLLSVAATPDT